MAQDAPRRRRARPVADVPVVGLASHGEEIAKGWLLALLEELPLESAPELISEALTRDAPALCAAMAAALASDEALAALGPSGALRTLAASVGALTGARDALGAARAVDALGDVLWSALRARLGADEAELVADLAPRLALVCAVVRDAAIAGVGGERAPGAVDGAPVEAGVGGGEAAAEGAPPDPDSAGGRAAAGGEAAAVSVGPAPERAGSADPAAMSAEPAEDLWSIPAPDTAPAPPPAPLWLSALEDEVGEAMGEGRPLSLLLAELEDAHRVIASAAPERVHDAVGGFVSALRGSLRAHDVLVCEADARAWVIARDTARPAAHSLAARIAEAVGETAPFSGAPLAASVGIAVLGEDGDSGSELVEAAEEARFTASARGIEVSRRTP